MNLITITVSGGVSSGKSAILATIKGALERHNLAVVYAHREHRNNSPDDIESADHHEGPHRELTVIALREEVNSRT